MAKKISHHFWQGEFIRVVVPSMLSLLLFVWVVYFFILPSLRTHLTDRKLELIRELTSSAISSLEVYQEKYKSGQLSLALAQEEAREHLRRLRYGPRGKDYFWISDLDARLVMHPYRLDLEGRDLSDFRDISGKKPFVEFARAARQGGHGYIPYYWQWKDDPDLIAPKLSYVKLFEPWNWVVGTGIYVDDVEREVGAMTSRLGWMSLIVLVVVGLLAAYVVYEGLRSEKSRRLAEWDVREGQERYHSVMEAAAEPLVIYNLQGLVEYCNPAFNRVFGWSLEELKGKKVDFVPPEERGPTMEVIRRVFKGEICRDFETRRLTKDGRVLQIMIGAAMFRDGAGEPSGMVVNLRDHTEKQQLEQQLQHAQKMEAIGTLAGGVAHEFNNLIMAVQGYTELVVQQADLDPVSRDYLGKIESSCQRAADLTRKMLTFSRLEVGRKEAVNLNRLVEGVRELLGRTVPPRITVETVLAVDLPAVLAQAPLLEQVLVNLGINACDAITGLGIIRFRTQVAYLSEEFSRANPWARPGRNVQVQVEDDGEGMPPEVLDRIFDPFFTTKEPGRGTGLGLSVAYSIMDRLGGHISVQSKPGQGSRFTMWLPAYEGEIAATQSQAAQLRHIPGAGEHLLVVDDEPHIREIVAEMLTAHGYRVSLAQNGQEALDVYASAREADDPFELVLLDLAMPVMDGQECLKRLKELDPEAKVILATGHGAQSVAADGLLQMASTMLLKPYDMRNLITTVSEILAYSEKS